MSERKKMGRPRSDTEPVMIRMTPRLIEAIDNRRREEPDLPTRPEMIRRILADALNLAEES
ncbi:MAG TPA: hypothetical protein PLI13_09315 [Paracoccus sp. (in: a-proteobacteria)]|nr:hypothetical protein [Paracoccus sp. (in: a-proteobacteria)]